MAHESLCDPSVCVVSPTGLGDHLRALRTVLCGEYAHADLDLRMRVRCGRGGSTGAGEGNNDDDDDDGCDGPVGGGSMTTTTTTLEDCARIIDAVLADVASENGRRSTSTTDVVDARNDRRESAALALGELAMGVSSLADASFVPPLIPPDVHVRVVVASDYRAIDPMFHTDKCPLRAYVTLCGPGTEYVDVTCSPWEYAALRALGIGAGATATATSSARDDANENEQGPRPIPRVREAKEMEFIVMKGDRYVHPPRMGGGSLSLPATWSTLWSRSSACVHRSPPGSSSSLSSSSSSSSSGGGRGVRRVILSLDLANGEDDREWFEAGRKREWRSGMTQRKSRLVS